MEKQTAFISTPLWDTHRSWNAPAKAVKPVVYIVDYEMANKHLLVINDPLFKNSMLPRVHTLISVAIDTMRKGDYYNQLYSMDKSKIPIMKSIRGRNATVNPSIDNGLFKLGEDAISGDLMTYNIWDSTRYIAPIPPKPHCFGDESALASTYEENLLHYDVIRILSQEVIEVGHLDTIRRLTQGFPYNSNARLHATTRAYIKLVLGY